MEHLDVSSSTLDQLIDHEWLVGNGLGGFASSTVCGMNTRKYHGLLVAAMAPPVRRMAILSRIDELVVGGDGISYSLSTNEYPGTIYPLGHQHLRAFSTDPFPRWAYQADGFTLEKTLRVVEGQNTVCLTYTVLAGEKSVELELRPLFALRGIHELMYQWNGRLLTEDLSEDGHVGSHHRIPASTRTPEAFFAHDGRFSAASSWYLNTIYRREQERGYAGLEDLWMPGVIRYTLKPGQTVHFVCSTDPINFERVIGHVHREPPRKAPVVLGQPADAPLDRDLGDLLGAARSFVVGTNADVEAIQPSVGMITQYPWSSPSYRSALVALPGVLLIPGRVNEARQLRAQIAALADQGVIPTNVPESGDAPTIAGADTSLWFINAVYQYWRYTGDDAFIASMLPVLESIIAHYRAGTKLGISMDGDGLIASRVPDQPTSWMDAKVNEWVVTPRQGRTVELNALWYNALRATANLAGRCQQEPQARELVSLAENVKQAFNLRFWNDRQECCFDLIDNVGPDATIRPNQLLAISLPFPVLLPDRFARVVNRVIDDLLIPGGVRTLSPRDPAYQGRYTGNVISRDRAQHQGSAYPWLLGPLVTAMLRAKGSSDQAVRIARLAIQPTLTYLRGAGMGRIPQLVDGDAPHRPGGALASAAATGELIRCLAEDVLGICPPRRTLGSTASASPLSAAGKPQ